MILQFNGNYRRFTGCVKVSGSWGAHRDRDVKLRDVRGGGSYIMGLYGTLAEVLPLRGIHRS